MKDKYTYGWHDPRGVYGESKLVEENQPDKTNVPTWFRLAVKLFYWITKKGREK
jgi:hypothetical protein